MLNSDRGYSQLDILSSIGGFNFFNGHVIPFKPIAASLMK